MDDGRGEDQGSYRVRCFGPDGPLGPDERFSDLYAALAFVWARFPDTDPAPWIVIAEGWLAAGVPFDWRVPLTVEGSTGPWYAVVGRAAASPCVVGCDGSAAPVEDGGGRSVPEDGGSQCGPRS